jgi:valyl-tRNA synthetase
MIAALAGLDPAGLVITESLSAKPENSAALVIGPLEVFLPLADLVDPAEERARLTKELSDAEAQIARLQTLLGSDFANKAPAAVVNKEREKLATFKETAEKIRAQLG